jgi:chromosome segregation ATPase
MITDEDIEKLKTTFATKNDLQGLKNDFQEFREEFSVVKENVQAILTILDKQNKPIVELQQENAMATGRLNRHEGWIKHIAQETNTTLITE